MSQDRAVRVLPGSVRYELQISSFTPAGTFGAAAEHLDHLVNLGVDVVELAPERPVEAASGLPGFVAACHRAGLAVLLGLPEPVTLTDLRQLFARYRLDGVRAPSVTAELAAAVQKLVAELGRPLALLPAAEVDASGEHALHALLAGGSETVEVGSPETLADVLHEALLHAGSVSRGGHRELTAHHFVGTPQGGSADRRLVRVGATLLLTGPFTPVVFMGEEWGASTRRRPELALTEAAPAPERHRAAGRSAAEQSMAAVGSAVAGLDWSEPASPGHAELLAFYRRLIALRRANADLADPRLDRVRVRYGDQFIAMRRGDCGVVANLAATPRRVTLDGYPRQVLLASEPGARLTRDAVDLPGHSAIIVSYA